TSNQMLGTWQYQNLDFDFKINVNLPGIEEQLKSNMLQKIEKEIEGTKVTYKADGNFEVQSAKNNTTGKYKVENNELVHSDFNNQETIMSYANAEVDGDILTLQVTEEQFWKMLGSLPAAQNGIDQIKQMITVNRLVYTFKKVN